MAKIDKVREVAISSLVPYKKNAKLHGPEQIEKIAESIAEFGFISPCLIDENNNVIAGHGRIEAAKRLGFDEVPCVTVEGLTEAQRRAYILADNRLTELGGWDMELVMSELNDLQQIDFNIELTGFEMPEELPPVEEDNYEDNKDLEPRSKFGDIWQLGDHRLMCGDSTSIDDVENSWMG